MKEPVGRLATVFRHACSEMWKDGRIMSCEMNDYPLGWEIRCYLQGDFHYSHV